MHWYPRMCKKDPKRVAHSYIPQECCPPPPELQTVVKYWLLNCLVPLFTHSHSLFGLNYTNINLLFFCSHHYQVSVIVIMGHINSLPISPLNQSNGTILSDIDVVLQWSGIMQFMIMHTLTLWSNTTEISPCIWIWVHCEILCIVQQCCYKNV